MFEPLQVSRGEKHESASDRSVGGLGQTLVPLLGRRGDVPVIFDFRSPGDSQGEVFIQGSILDREKLYEACRGCDCIVHIAAWHSIHEVRGEKDSYDFLDLNVCGTFEVLEAAASLGVNNIVFISTTRNCAFD